MALNDRKRKIRPVVAKVEDNTEEIISKKINIIESDFVDFENLEVTSAANRKTIKVDPDVKQLISIFSNFDGKNEYETLKDIVEFYYKENYDERAQRIIGINFYNTKK